MRSLRSLLLAFIVLLSFGGRAFAAEDPLFINLTSDLKDHSAEMALVFAKNAVARGHEVTVFLNDQAVIGASVSYPGLDQVRALLELLIDKKATVIACRHCMAHYGVDETALIKGIRSGDPDLVFGKLFAPGTRTLSW